MIKLVDCTNNLFGMNSFIKIINFLANYCKLRPNQNLHCQLLVWFNTHIVKFGLLLEQEREA